MMSKLFYIFVFILAVSCATSPTGRKQFILMSDGAMNGMGAQAFDEMKTKSPKSRNSKTNGYVDCVAQTVAREAVDSTGVDRWEVVVFEDSSANAFALPGGKIGVHTGLLKVAKTPSQLAAVLGHEVGHVIARHGNERVSQAMAAQAGLSAADLLTKENKNRGLIMAALGLGSQFGVMLPHGRKQESEADQIGIELMAKAGFDPRESVQLWKNMGAASGGKQPPEFLSTHPSHETRIGRLQSHMPKAMGLYEVARRQGKNAKLLTLKRFSSPKFLSSSDKNPMKIVKSGFMVGLEEFLDRVKETDWAKEDAAKWAKEEGQETAEKEPPRESPKENSVNSLPEQKGFPPLKPLPENIQKAISRIQKSRKQKADTVSSPDGFLVFRVGSRRFAISMKMVAETGRIQHRWWLTRKCQSKYGDIPLRDIKKTLSMGGIAGNAYLVTRSKSGYVSWAVDGFESFNALKTVDFAPSQSLAARGAITTFRES